MRRALEAWADALGAGATREEAVLAAARAVAAEPWAVVRHAGLLARCEIGVAPQDLSLSEGLGVLPPGHGWSVRDVLAGQPYPLPRSAGRSARGAFDTPAGLARRVVAACLAGRPAPASALDPTCGTGAFLVALTEAGVANVHGSDLDPLAVAVARIAAPDAEIVVADALDPGPRHALVVANPPFVAPERQDKALRARLSARFPWLRGRFDLVIPLAAAAGERCAAGGTLGLVLPAAALSQPYGAPLRRRWLAADRVLSLTPPEPFPGASVQVCTLVLALGEGPANLPSGVSAAGLLALPDAPLDPGLLPGDLELFARIQAASVPLGTLARIDTGVVTHLPGGSREHLLHDLPGPGRVPYADARDFFAGRRRWLDYRPDRMHRAKSPELFEPPKIVVQRIRGRHTRAAVDTEGVFVGHTCTVVVPTDARVPIERLRDLIASPLAAGLQRVERGARVDLYPRDIGRMPVPVAWLRDATLSLADAWGLGEGGAARLAALGGAG